MLRGKIFMRVFLLLRKVMGSAQMRVKEKRIMMLSAGELCLKDLWLVNGEA